MSSRSKQRKSVSFQSLKSDNEVKPLPSATVFNSPINLSISLIPFHYPLLVAWIYGGLLENPNKALLKGIPTLIAAQIAYGLLITRQFNSVSGSKKGSKKNDSENVPILLVGSIIISLLLSFPLFIVVIIFGAPLYGLLSETFLLAVHLSLVIFFPVLVSYKLDLSHFLSNFKPGSGDQLYPLLYKNQLILASIGCIVGSWFGVLPIPLDWDRDWQQWPITIFIGGYIGAFVGNIISLPLQ